MFASVSAGSDPDRRDEEVPALLAVRDGGLGHADARHGAVEVLEQDRRHRRRDGREPLDRDVDQLVGEAAREARQPVVERAGREAGVEERVHHRVRHRADLDHQRRAPGLERREVALRLPRGRRCGRRPAPRASSPEPSGACTSPANTVRSSERVRDRVAVEAQQVGRGVDRVGDQAADDHPHRVQAVGERRRDAEVAAAAAQRPEQVRVRTRRRPRARRRPPSRARRPSRLSAARPYLAISQPSPPPSV